MNKLRHINAIMHVIKWILVVVPIPGYIHPDEFFQCTEVMAAPLLKFESVYTWEWDCKKPARNILFPSIVAGLPFGLLKVLDVQLTTELVLIMPRLTMALLTFCIDCLFRHLLKMIHNTSIKCDVLLFLFRSSHVTLNFMNHTFSNSIETLILTIIMCLLLAKYKGRNFEERWYFDFMIGFFLGFGFFVRQSIIAFTFFPLVHFVIVVVLTYPIAKTITLICRFLFKSLCGLVVAMCLCIVADSIFFSKSGKIDLWQITPLNLITYNSQVENLKQHGLHPWYLHITINMLILFGPLYVVVVYQWFASISYMNLKAIISKRYFLEFPYMLAATVVFGIGILSLIPHQEPRFLLPVIIPLISCLAISSNISYVLKRNWFIISWVVFNVVALVFYGFLHQAGLIPSLAYINRHIKKININDGELLGEQHFIFWKTYKVPKHLAMLEEGQSNVFIHDLAGSKLATVEQSVLSATKKNRSEVYVISPSTLHEELFRNKVNISFNLKRQFFPHVTMEDFPDDFWSTSISTQWFSLSDFHAVLKKSFSLNLYAVVNETKQ